MTIGATLSGNVVIVDDVITAGTAIKESNLIASAGANVTGIIVGLDRKEKGLTKYSAIQEIQRDYEIPIVSIVDIDDIIRHVTQHESSEIYCQIFQNTERNLELIRLATLFRLDHLPLAIEIRQRIFVEITSNK